MRVTVARQKFIKFQRLNPGKKYGQKEKLQSFVHEVLGPVKIKESPLVGVPRVTLVPTRHMDPGKNG